MDVLRNFVTALRNFKVKFLKELIEIMAEPKVSYSFFHPPIGNCDHSQA